MRSYADVLGPGLGVHLTQTQQTNNKHTKTPSYEKHFLHPRTFLRNDVSIINFERTVLPIASK